MGGREGDLTWEAPLLSERATSLVRIDKLQIASGLVVNLAITYAKLRHQGNKQAYLIKVLTIQLTAE